MINVDEFENKLLKFKRRLNTAQRKSIQQQLSDDTKYQYMRDNEIIFGHTMLHYLYSKNIKHLDGGWNKEKIVLRHRMLITEMANRGISHKDFDVLDDYKAQKLEDAIEWREAFINNLPDEAFAIIIGGGPDDEGKTMPRAFRKFPHHNETVRSGMEHESVDLLHLRKMRVAVEAAIIPDEAKVTAKEHLDMHAKGLRISEFANLPEESEMIPEKAPIIQEESCTPIIKIEIINRIPSLKQYITSLSDNSEQELESPGPLTTKMRNQLPDKAFAIVLSGGRKVGGITVPRTLRKLPHHTSNVKTGTEHDTIDLPRLRNALARVEQPATKLTDVERAKARRHLKKHARALKIGEFREN